jgi:uncharacterized protein with HEPN domain
MPDHSTSIYLRDMLDHAREAIEFAQGRTRSDLDSDRKLSLSLVRLLEVIGEAAGRVPKEYQLAHPEIPWSQIAGLRNRLIHGYGSVDLDIVWRIVTNDLPPLVRALEQIVQAGC